MQGLAIHAVSLPGAKAECDGMGSIAEDVSGENRGSSAPALAMCQARAKLSEGRGDGIAGGRGRGGRYPGRTEDPICLSRRVGRSYPRMRASGDGEDWRCREPPEERMI